MDPVPDPLLLWKSGSAGNRTRDLWICSQEFWPLEHKGGLCNVTMLINWYIPVLNLRFLQRWLERALCCDAIYAVDVHGLSKQPTSSIFMFEEQIKQTTSKKQRYFPVPWFACSGFERWIQYVPPKRQLTSIQHLFKCHFKIRWMLIYSCF
jgi:hypothetical protein